MNNTPKGAPQTPARPNKSGQTSKDFRNRLQKWVVAISRAMECSKNVTELHFDVLKRGRNSTSFRVYSGENSAFLKLFDETSGSDGAWQREHAVYAQMKGASCIPRHIAHCTTERFLLSEFVAGNTLDTHLTSQNCVAYAQFLGAWLGTFDATALYTPCTGNWADYLSKYGAVPDRHLGNLEQIPLLGNALAQCDGALSNFIVTPKRTLIGFDFENARLKPRGWDLLLTFDSFFVKFPSQRQAILHALVDGFFQTHKGAMLQADLLTLAHYWQEMRIAPSSFTSEHAHGR